VNKTINEYEGISIPKRARIGDCGYDVFLPFEVTFKAGEYQTIDLGVKIEEGDIGRNNYIMVVPRSSMGMKYGLKLRNTLGIIDSGYRDSIKASLCTDVDVTLTKNTRILQMIVTTFGLIAHEIPPNDTRNGGVGSTGE